MMPNPARSSMIRTVPQDRNRITAVPVQESRPAAATTPVDAPSGTQINISAAIRKHPFLAAAPIILGLVLGVPYALRSAKSEYHAEASIYVTPTYQKNQQSDKEQLQVTYSTLVNQQVLTIRRFDILSDALKRLDRDKNIKWARPGESETSAVARLMASLDVRPVPDSYEVIIGISADRQEWVAPIVNAVAESYLEKQRSEELADRDRRFRAFQVARGSLDKALQEKLDQQSRLSAVLNVVSVYKAPNDNLLAGARQALEEVKRKRIEAETRLAVMTSVGGNGKSALTSSVEDTISNDAAIRTFSVYLMQRSVDLQAKIQGLTPEHPLRQSTEKEIAAINSQLASLSQAPVNDMAARLMTKLRVDVDHARLLENELQKQVASGSANVATVARQVQLGEGLSEEIERLRKSLGAVNGSIEMSIQETIPGVARIFSTAQTPLGPLKTGIERMLSLILGAAVLLSLALCVAVDQFDQRIRAPWEVQRAIGFRPLGVLLKKNGDNDAFADEQFWRLVNSIQRSVALHDARSVVFSPLHLAKNPPNLVADIADALNASGLKTTILNAKPHMGKAHTDAEEIKSLAPSDMSNVDSRPEGSIVLRDYSDSNQLARVSAGSRETMDSLQREYDLVLLDAPSLLVSAEMEYLGVICDMTLIVAEAGKATRKELVRGAELLKRISAPSVGVIITDVNLRSGGAELKEDFKRFQSRHASDPTVEMDSAVGSI